MSLAKTVPNSYSTVTWGLCQSYISHRYTKFCLYITYISPIYYQKSRPYLMSGHGTYLFLSTINLFFLCNSCFSNCRLSVLRTLCIHGTSDKKFENCKILQDFPAWSIVAFYGPAWSSMDPFAHTWSIIVCYQPIRTSMVLHGPLWPHMVWKIIIWI